MRPIRYLGDPVLRGKTENVKSINQDIKLLVQSENTQHIQECFLIIEHIICENLDSFS